MNRIRTYSALLALFIGVTVAAKAQSAVAPSAADPNSCPAPGERRPGPPGIPNGAQAGQAGARPEPPQPAGPPRKRLLIWADTRNGIAQHDIAHAEAIIEELGYKSGLWDSWIRTDSNIIARRPIMTTGEPASGGPSLCNVDAIFFLGHREIELNEQGRKDLLWFVHDAGKGFVISHTGSGAFMSWPEFGKLAGGRYDEHPWNQIEAKVIVTDPKFPGLDKLGGSFVIKDEFYQINEFSPTDSRVLLRLDTTSLDMTRKGVNPADYPWPLAYAKMYGKGRVFYSSFAHAPATWDDVRIQDMYMGAIKWALGLVDADVTPLPMPPPPKTTHP